MSENEDNPVFDNIDTAEDFIRQDVKPLIKTVLKKALGDKVYDYHKVNYWTKNICEEIIDALQEMRKDYKFVILFKMMQNLGMGMNRSMCSYWNQTEDGHYSITWNNETILVALTIFTFKL